MAKKSAGLLLYRINEARAIEVLLVHPGGPFWRNKDEGAWTIPKGEFDDLEDALLAAKREFEEEIGATAPDGEYFPLEPVKQKNGKVVHAWGVRGDFDPTTLRSNSFELEWPPKSGRSLTVPEVDRAEWFSPDAAKRKIISAQASLIDELLTIVG